MANTVKIEREADAVVLDFLRKRLSERLTYLTGPQRQKLATVLGVREVRPESLKRKALERAIDLIDRQVRKDDAAK